ncbi:MAG: dihydrodipicolinate synthase family protein [Ardenticatenaceae bacterium]|nr:dihydrodipicolinate synthase family protein [Ardenticatenaceae bacterium]HBY94290.1 dihydrodipicolinate synthase family protein [Chloroflexota bacterium]
MSNREAFSGVFAAAVTPLRADYSLDLDAVPSYLDFLARRGCHGALLLGTTGEGPSFAPAERVDFFRAALAFRQTRPSFRLLAGVGTPSLEETVFLTKSAFDLGFDGVVSLPPFYYRAATDDGLFAWFEKLIQRAVPAESAFFGYHFPAVSGVPLSLDLIARLKEAFPDRFAGLKDSSNDPAHTRALGRRFGDALMVLTGSDSLFSLALDNHAAGCITALANLISPSLRRIWDAHETGSTDAHTQLQMTHLHRTLAVYPTTALVKALLADLHEMPRWPLRPPLLPLMPEAEREVLALYQ